MFKSMLLAAGAAAILTIGVAGPAAAADHEIKMLNRGAAGMMVFEPAFLKVEPGDTVIFVPTDKSHNAESITTMTPEGGATFKSKVNDEVTVTLDVPGVYGIKCLPHYAMGMVALIQVGDDPVNLEEARAVKHPGKARVRMEALFGELEAATQ